mmetsp:Transcript_14173/g.20388  ORF Transcript_14173/g.20388 Transcript_14173/m.20388 type:complete len:101 (+) Transcript_14173:156-458(+)
MTNNDPNKGGLSFYNEHDRSNTNNDTRSNAGRGRNDSRGRGRGDGGRSHNRSQDRAGRGGQTPKVEVVAGAVVHRLAMIMPMTKVPPTTMTLLVIMHSIW